MASLLSLPKELLDEIINQVNIEDVKTLALCSSQAREAVASKLYKSLIIRPRFHDPEVFKRWDGCNSSATRNVELILQSRPWALSFVKGVRERKGRAEYGLYERRTPECENILVRTIFSKFEKGQLREIWLNRWVSLETAVFLLSSQPRIERLKLRGVCDIQYEWDYLINGTYKNLQNIQWGKLKALKLQFCQDIAVPFLIRVLHGNKQSLRSIQLGFYEALSVTGNHYNANKDRWLFLSRSREDIPGEMVPVLKLHETQHLGSTLLPALKFELPYLENLSLHHTQNLDERIQCKFPGLRRLKLSFCSKLDGFFADLLLSPSTRISDNLRALELVSCSCNWNMVERVLPAIRALETLLWKGSCDLNHTFGAIAHHRTSLKRLWIECDNEHSDTKCLAVSRFLNPEDELNTAPLKTENWPLLEELIINVEEEDHVEDWDVWKLLPLLHNLKLLKLFVDCDYDTFSEMFTNYQPKILDYASRLFSSYLGGSTQRPALKVFGVACNTNSGYRGEMGAFFCPLVTRSEAGPELRIEKLSTENTDDSGKAHYRISPALLGKYGFWDCAGSERIKYLVLSENAET